MKTLTTTIAFCSLLLVTNLLSAQSPDKWYDGQAWLNGLKLKPHASINKELFEKEYKAHPADWDKAFAYLKNTNLAELKPGKYNIDGEQVYVTVTEGPTKDFDSSVWEAHRNYNDIHYILKGKEKIGVASPDKLQVKTPYDATREVGFYTGDGKFYVSDPETFFIFFPSDAHRPSIKVDGYDTVKKIVVKVHVAK